MEAYVFRPIGGALLQEFSGDFEHLCCSMLLHEANDAVVYISVEMSVSCQWLGPVKA
jgi:hypothetical protein